MDQYAVRLGLSSSSAVTSRFRGASGVEEHHIMVRPTEYGSIDVQLASVLDAYREALEAQGLDPQTAVFRRFFLSDVVNQAPALDSEPLSSRSNPQDPCAVSWVGQPPSPPAKVALWAYHVNDPVAELAKTQEGCSLILDRGELIHYWSAGLAAAEAPDSYEQTWNILRQYEACLRDFGCTIADNLIRTWFMVQNVDANYQGLVVARRECFAERGLTADTHYIASTGIEGDNADVAARVTLDAYAIGGVRPQQVEYLAALTHLSPTHVYGVTFERATSVAYRDRTHIHVSGTASINHEGEVLHTGDVCRQLDRTLENVEALLQQGGATLQDMQYFIVYVRDPSDHAVAGRQMVQRFPDAPMVVVTAPVCRPGWLIEVEGMAVVPAQRPNLPPF